MGASGLPVRRYLASLAVAALAFMALAILDQRETFLGALLPGRSAPEAGAAPDQAAEADRAVGAVRAFNAAVGEAYVRRSSAPLEGVAMSDAVRAELELEIGDRVAGPAATGLRLTDLEVLRVEPAGGAWQVTTDETWSGAGVTSRHRLRFRYRLVPAGERLRVEEITPILPEPK